MAKHDFVSLMRRLSRGGFPKSFLSAAVLPEWWSPDCEQDASLLPEVELRVARFLDRDLATVRSPNVALGPSACPGAQLRRVRATERDRLRPALHAALRVSEAVARMSAGRLPLPDVPPDDAAEWHRALLVGLSRLDLACLATDLWQRGIPVVPLQSLPAPSFQAMACVVLDRPIVLLGQAYDEPGRLAFAIAHEVGHLSSGDCATNRPVLDGGEEDAGDAGSEQAADAYAVTALTGSVDMPELRGHAPSELAQAALTLQNEKSIDAGVALAGWARSTGDYATMARALAMVNGAKGGRGELRRQLERYLCLDEASDSDRALLGCLYGGRVE